MSDALCGPSNPLQQFKQQTQLDRTLQQDRLTSRNTALQGFRSHNPNAGVLDSEFEAFQAGLPIAEHPQFHQQLPQFAGPSQTPSWATDFQRMHISSPPPPALQQQHIPQAGPATSNWASGFQQHVSQAAPRAQMSQHSPQQFQHMARYGGGMNNFQSNNFSQSNFAHSTPQTKGKAPATEQFDEAAFERAFDLASQDMMTDAVEDFGVEKPAYEAGASTGNLDMANEAQLDQNNATGVKRERTKASPQSRREWLQRNPKNLAIEEESAAREFHRVEDIADPQPIDRLEDQPQAEDTAFLEEQQTEQAEQNLQQDDGDALAATAKELLEKVEHNQTDKFKNSQFLGLMRKLRDREMKVEGDNMVETTDATAIDTTTSTASTQNSNQTSTSSTTLQFDNTEQTPRPLGLSSSAGMATHVDTRPHDYGIPEQYQDHDQGRINPKDGQEVVDLLNQRGGLDAGADQERTDDIAVEWPENMLMA